SMLANTNDAFTGLTSLDIGSMAVGDSMTMMTHVFDAGTEANTESAGTIAGPADDSAAADKAYSATRDDLHDFVSVHAGVVTMDDGLTTSVLNESHRWNGMAAKITIERL
ncbi:MAG: spondin domain-containing protein, partial [Gammaproteobacteria bacterium]|nr:spondin domain-containing protein [Gammaproteobacteria bacterium]